MATSSPIIATSETMFVIMAAYHHATYSDFSIQRLHKNSVCLPSRCSVLRPNPTYVEVYTETRQQTPKREAIAM